MQLDPRLSEISLDGFQVVSGQMFAHLPRKSDATCTLWPTSISFSKQAVVLLNNCEHIRIEINPTTKGLLVVPADQGVACGPRNKQRPGWRPVDQEYQVACGQKNRMQDFCFTALRYLGMGQEPRVPGHWPAVYC